MITPSLIRSHIVGPDMNIKKVFCFCSVMFFTPSAKALLQHSQLSSKGVPRFPLWLWTPPVGSPEVQKQRAQYFNDRRLTTSLEVNNKRGSIVDTYRTVSVSCASCGERLFRYKKKNGTKSNLIKCFIERITEDSAGVLQNQGLDVDHYFCPSCKSRFARFAIIRGMPALKLAGGKTIMKKK